jgi:hypothetical protein
MKVKKLLAIVLAMLLVLSFASLVSAQQSGEPGSDSGSSTARTETQATQAFEKSLDAKGLFLWRWNWTQANPGDKIGGGWASKAINNQVWQGLMLALNYSISPQLKISATLYNRYRWGEALDAGYGSDGRSTINAFNPNGYTFADDYSSLASSWRGTVGTATTAWATATGIQTVTINAPKNVLLMEQISMTWEPGGFFNTITIGRVQNSWGFGGGLMMGAMAGVDRFVWVGKTKMFGYMALPVMIFELRSDQTTNMQGDERLILMPAIVLVGPGKFIEMLGFTVFHDGLAKKSYDKSTVKNTPSYTGMALSMTMRSGTFLKINFEFIGFMGRLGRINTTFVDLFNSGTNNEFRLDFMKIFLSAEINLGMIGITPEFAFVTAPKSTYHNTMMYNAVTAAYDIPVLAMETMGGNLPFYTQFYQVGGFLMSGNPASLSGTGRRGLFLAALKADFKLMGGAFVPWIKFAWGTSLSKYVATSAVSFVNVDTYKTANGEQLTRSLGFEVDLGIKVQLTDGLTMALEFGVLILPKSVSGDGVAAGYGNGIVYNDYTGRSTAMGINCKFDLKF